MANDSGFLYSARSAECLHTAVTEDFVQQCWCCPVLLTIMNKIGPSLCSAVMSRSLLTLLLSLPSLARAFLFNEIHTMLILLPQDIVKA